MNRNDIRGKLFAEPELDEVDVPEWGGVVKVRPLMWIERNAIFAKADAIAETHGINRDEVAAGLGILAALCDDDGVPVMEDGDIDRVSLDQLNVAISIISRARPQESVEDREEN